MLQLQRASAGSGKTYTLAKKFIWFFLTVKDDNGLYRLRSSQEIAAALPGILAITFTNKATHEMKLRIVDKLADLARVYTDQPLSPDELKKINYISEFSHSLHTNPINIGKAASIALSVILNDYSEFKVSTIDSFFQTILRTFAYESNLNDAYQVEIDSDFLSQAAVDSTLDDINSSREKSVASFWIRKIMDEKADTGSNGWNMFARKEGRDSIYVALKNAIKRLDNEDFKQIREILDDYFCYDDSSESQSPDDDPLIKAYKEIINDIVVPMEASLKKAQDAARRLYDLFSSKGYDPKQCTQYFENHIKKIPRLKLYTKPSLKSLKKVKATGSYFKNPDFGQDTEIIHSLVEKMTDNYDRWLQLHETPEWKHWLAYSQMIPYLGLIGVARRKMNEFLDASNSIQLGETNSMLRRIISDDDTPFIYERLGSRLTNYLIDEFQDTSAMQWQNLLPLLKESDSHGDNLIIGDAKQSIYRFRNADPTLISTVVPLHFPIRIDAGMSKADNTNWRSARNIVEFNNFFFSALVKRLLPFVNGSIDLKNLYSNVVQFSNKRDREGYVEINFLQLPEMPDNDGKIKKKKKHNSDDEKSIELVKLAMKKICPLIKELIERGYCQRDIAILVDTNKIAQTVISSVINYNSSLSNPDERIEFISEESLLVSSSEAVGIIINVLEKLASGTLNSDNNSERRSRRWSEIRSDFFFYSLRHPDLSAADRIRGFLDEVNSADAINTMMADMQSVALPALVEAITENFVPENLRMSQALFIAALQDIVLEYCNAHPADPASFIHWWHLKGVTRSISSPEGTDAVQIMTIHKAKGLEFPCVILPMAKSAFAPSNVKCEWRWVKPAKCFEGFNLPEVIPVETKSTLSGTEHEKQWSEYSDLVMMDCINKYYVAFTRAVNELYIFTEEPVARSNHLGSHLKDICLNYDKYLYDISLSEPDASLPADEFFPPASFAIWNEDETAVSVGKRVEPLKMKPAEDNSTHLINDYAVNSSPSILHFVEADDDSSALSDYEEDDLDPRSEGNLLHAVMERIKTPEDLHRSLLQLKMRGFITSEVMTQWEEWLSKILKNPKVSDWFDPKWKVLNERSILFPRGKNRRPDRIIIAPDRSMAVIIDYKFGAVPQGKVHINQVADYIKAFKEASGILNVSGFVWYVKNDHIQAVFA